MTAVPLGRHPNASTGVWRTRQPGTYVLLIHLAEPASLEVGRLGRVHLPAGWYAYVGSALGGLGARLRRHARHEKRPHWHIDRLLTVGRLVAVAARLGHARVECETAAAVAALPGARLPVRRFGASDCRCPAHLMHFEERPDVCIGPAWQLTTLPVDPGPPPVP